MAKHTGHTITSDSALGAAKIQRSLRFNDDDSAYLNRTPSSAGNRKTYTISAWVKRCTIGGVHPIFSRYTANNDAGFLGLYINSDDYIYFTGWSTVNLKSNRLYRDLSAWSHIVLVVDTTQSTSTDRIKLYFNGELETLGTYNAFSQNADTAINEAVAHRVGNYSSNYFDGYMAEVNFVDGYAYDASYFGYTDPVTGSWMPRRYEGTYGTNGFHLDFLDNSSTSTLGIDKSPNGNDFTANNFSVSSGKDGDSFTDTPTLNFPTLNALSPASSTSGTLSNGNLEVTKADYIMHRANFIFGPGGIQSGKWYWEVTNVNSSDSAYANYTGITGDLTQDGGEVYLEANKSTLGSFNYKTYTSTSVISRTNEGTNKTMQFLLDVDNQQLIAKYDGTTIFTDTSIPSASTTNYVPFVMTTNSGTGGSLWSDSHFNFGQRSFTYTLPTGYKTLNSRNIPPNVPSIIRPQKHFDTILWAGNGSSQTISGLEFAPDLVWLKCRNSSSGRSHIFTDTVRGATKSLLSPESDAEDTFVQDLTAFTPDGFSVGSNGRVNENSTNLVGWCWKAGGSSTVSNTDGNQTTQVSVNEEAGFSIVTYTGTGSNTNIGHGLGAVPDMIITKSRSATGSWAVLDKFNTTAEYGFFLNDNGGYSSYQGGTYWNDTPPTSTVFRVSTNAATNASGVTYVAYCWTSIPGYSKIGKYTGNGSADGAFEYVGFRPAWVLFKRTDSGGNWFIVDNKRDPFNECTRDLYPNSFGAETNNPNFVDFLSNGFKLRTTGTAVNASGGTYIYMAFAEQPGTTPFETFTDAR